MSAIVIELEDFMPIFRPSQTERKNQLRAEMEFLDRKIHTLQDRINAKWKEYSAIPLEIASLEGNGHALIDKYKIAGAELKELLDEEGF